MKKFVFLMVLFCTFLCANAQSDTSWSYKSVCYGNSTIWTVPFANNSDICVCSHNGIYDTITGNTFTLSPDSTTIYIFESINGNQPNQFLVYGRIVTVKHPQTFTIITDSVHHVSCPGGSDGSFSVTLDSATSNYEWIEVCYNSPFSPIHVYYDDFTIDSLYGGTYHIVSREITTHCEYHDSISIQTPPDWSYNFEESTFDTIKCNKPSTIYFSFNGGTLPYSYEWHYSEDWDMQYPDTSHINANYPGTYWCWIHDANNCLVMDVPIIADIYQIMVDSVSLLGPEVTCYGDSISLTAWSLGHGDYIWSTGDSTMDIYTRLDTSSWVSVKFTDQNGCETQDSIFVEIRKPFIELDLPDYICQNADPINLNDYTTSTTDDNGWNRFYGENLNIEGIFNPYLNTGEHSIIAVHNDGIYGCTSSDTATFEIVEPEYISLDVPHIMYRDSDYVIYSPYSNGILTIGDIEIPGNNEFIIHPIEFEPGSYSLNYSVEFGLYNCTSIYECSIEICSGVGISSHTFQGRLYPNPASNILNIEFNGEFSGDIQLFDMTGRLLKTTENLSEITSIDVSDLTSGVYFIHFVSQSGTFTKKFVKK